jgi:hypothetical protein
MPTKDLGFESHAFRTLQPALPAGLAMGAIMSAAQPVSNAAARRSHAMRVGFIGLDHTGEAMASRALSD